MNQDKKDAPAFVFHFHGNVGQQIANVEHMDVHLDKDATMQVCNVGNLTHPLVSIPQMIPDKGDTSEVAVRKPKRSSKLKRKTKEHGIARDTFARAAHITDKHLDVLVQDMIQDGWLDKQTSKSCFRNLFSGKANACEIVWAGKVGLGSLKELFTSLKEEQLITLPGGARSVNSVLENHVVDVEGHFIRGLNSSEVAASSFQTIRKYIDLLNVHIQQDDIDKMFADLEQDDPTYF